MLSSEILRFGLGVVGFFYFINVCTCSVFCWLMDYCFCAVKIDRVLRLQAGHKYCLLGKLSSEVGWNHYDTIRVRIVAAALFFSISNLSLEITVI